MSITFNTTIHLDANAVEQIIREYLVKEKNVAVESIVFDTSKQLCGYGLGKYECLTFKGATARCEQAS
jgi:Arc/MetJ family transcription regulator